MMVERIRLARRMRRKRSRADLARSIARIQGALLCQEKPAAVRFVPAPFPPGVPGVAVSSRP